MNAKFYVLFVLLAICLAGCPHNRYKIEMKPAGNVLERTLSVSLVGGQTFSPAKGQDAETKPTTSKRKSKESVSKEELDRLGKVYPKRLSKPSAEVHKFTGKFTGKTPNDVGGFGSYRQFATQMGYASIYVERFRGNKNPAIAVAERLRAVDELTDLLIGWFQSEMGKDKRFGKLRNFMDKDLRRDLKNASTYLWLHDLRPREKSTDQYEMLMRIGLYFAERKYVCLEELPAISRALTTKADDDPANSLIPLIHRLVASKMGIGPKEPIPDSLKFLSDAEVAKKSLIVYLQNTKAFKEVLRAWKELKKTNPEATKPEPWGIIEDLAEKAFRMKFEIFGSDDELDVKLALPAKPFLTNGEWDKKRKKVAWSGTLENRTQDVLSVTLEREDENTYHRLPTLCYAVWAVPDKKFQRKHFGRIVLTDKALLEYCLWRKGLTDKEASEWDGFVAKCRPGKSLVNELMKFRFSDDPAPAETDTQPDSTSRAGGIRKIIEGLQNKN